MSGNRNSRKKQQLRVFMLKLLIILTVAAFIAASALFLFAFVAARGPYRDVSSRLCATLAERESPLAGVFFTTGEIRAATAYLPPAETDGVLRSSPAAEIPGDGSGITSVRISGKGWKGVLVRIEDPDAYSIELARGTGERDVSAVSCGLDGYVDAVYLSGCLSYAGYGGEDVYCAVACDAEGVLHMGAKTVYDLTGSSYRWAVSADRILISGGVPCENLGGGYASRAAVGQTEDGRILIAYAASRGIWPCGITYQELAALMYEYGAVNAAALKPMGSLRVGGSISAGGLGDPDYSLNVTARGVSGVE